jgi:regulatory protein
VDCRLVIVERPVPSTDPAYVAALRMLARRDLSEAQIRERLGRRGHASDAIDRAVARLAEEGAVDDRRVAAAIAHSETAIKRHGRRRVERQIEQAGISRATARAAVDEVFGGIDEEDLLEAALDRRLRRGRMIDGPPEFARLYRYLIGQGFDPDRVVQVLDRRRSPSFPR